MANINTLTLSNVVHSSRTALNYSRVTNHDAALLILHKLGGTATSKEIKKHLQAWRTQDNLAFTYLFNTSAHGGYGFVGKDVNSVSNQVYHCSEHGDCYTQRRTYWYRVKNGTYRLTLEGFRRLAELEAQLS
jgi:hypothetical protein